MKIAIMQPTYLPWLGYFWLIDQADCFVYLDDAQFVRGSWHQRNRILLNGAPHWITVPVTRQHLDDKINEAGLDARSPWMRKHSALILQTYAKHPFISDVKNYIDPLFSRPYPHLAALDMAMIEHACQHLEITTPRHRASDLGVAGVRTHRVVELCRHFGADIYLSPQGAREYLEADDFTGQGGPALAYSTFSPPAYPQPVAKTFIGYLSLIDALACTGWQGCREQLRAPTGNTP